MTGPRPAIPAGVRIAGAGRKTPEGVLSNADLERYVDTSDEWIRQRTGIRERRICDPTKGESPTWLCTEAARAALDDAGMGADEIDLIILGSVTGEMTCPSTACRVAAEIGAGNTTGAFDVLAACCGFVYGLNLAHDVIKAGSQRNVLVIGCDVMSRVLDFENRAVSVLFGDSAGAVVVTGCDDPERGRLAGQLRSDGSRWHDLYLPRSPMDLPPDADHSVVRMNSLQMNGREVYKFAVGTFGDLIGETLEEGGVSADDVDMFVCHQSNARMLEAARKRFGLPEDRLYINIDRYGNCSAGSVPVAYHELREAGRIEDGALVMFVAFGGGLTWASSLWRL